MTLSKATFLKFYSDLDPVHALTSSGMQVCSKTVTAVFKKVATFDIDFASRDGNRTHQNAFRSCDSNFVRQSIEIERIENFRQPNRT